MQYAFKYVKSIQYCRNHSTCGLVWFWFRLCLAFICLHGIWQRLYSYKQENSFWLKGAQALAVKRTLSSSRSSHERRSMDTPLPIIKAIQRLIKWSKIYRDTTGTVRWTRNDLPSSPTFVATCCGRWGTRWPGFGDPSLATTRWLSWSPWTCSVARQKELNHCYSPGVQGCSLSWPISQAKHGTTGTTNYHTLKGLGPKGCQALLTDKFLMGKVMEKYWAMSPLGIPPEIALKRPISF